MTLPYPKTQKNRFICVYIYISICSILYIYKVLLWHNTRHSLGKNFKSGSDPQSHRSNPLSVGTCAGYAQAAGEGALDTDRVRLLDHGLKKSHPKKPAELLVEDKIWGNKKKSIRLFCWLRPSKRWSMTFFSKISSKKIRPNWILFQKTAESCWKKRCSWVWSTPC